jgi:hypothetical protein
MEPEGHHRINKSTPPVSILIQIDQVYAPPPTQYNLSKKQFYVILPSTPVSFKQSRNTD